MEHSAEDFAVFSRTLTRDREVLRARMRDTSELLDMAADIVAAPDGYTLDERNALALVLRERARAFDGGARS